MIVAHPEIHGPIPKLNFLMRQGLEALGVKVRVVPYSRRQPSQAKSEPFLAKIVGHIKDMWGFVVNVRAERPDLLFVAHTTQDWNSILRDFPLVVLNHYFLRIPIVFLYHGSRAQELDTNSRLRFITNLFVSMTNGHLLLSEEELPYFKKHWPGHPLSCVPYPAVTSDANVVDLPRSFPEKWKDTDLPVLLFAGRVVRSKGIQELIDAMPIVLQRVKCRLVVLGEGALLKQLRARVFQGGIEGFVHFAGYVEEQKELQAWYYASHVFVLPTYWREGFPVVLLEALANGLPIVCTKIRGAADYFQDGINALFVPPRDPATLAKKLTELLENETLRGRMSHANRELIQQFEPAKAMNKYLYFFKKVLKDANSPA